MRKNKNKFVKELLKIFAEKTRCAAQFNGCPCNSCFHAIEDKIDFKHIVWLILLGLRGDYDPHEVILEIKEVLEI